MGRAGGLLVDGTAEVHLRIGALEDTLLWVNPRYRDICKYMNIYIDRYR